MKDKHLPTFTMLLKTGGNKSKAARLLELPLSTVRKHYNEMLPSQKRQIELWPNKHLPDAYSELVVMFLPLAEYYYKRKLSEMPASADHCELLSASHKGLMDAVRAFDPSLGIKFDTYAPRRILGAILDAIRDQDHVPRLVRGHETKRRRAEREFESEHGREPTDVELMRYLGWSREELLKSYPTQMSSLQDIVLAGDSDRPVERHEMIASKASIESITDKSARVREILKGLNIEEQTIVFLYYFKKNTMKQIGSALELSESRVSQMHSKILEGLRARGKDWFLEAVA